MLNSRTDVTSRVKRSTAGQYQQQSIHHRTNDQGKTSKNKKQIAISFLCLVLFIFCTCVTLAKYNSNSNNIPNNIIQEKNPTHKLIPPSKVQQPSVIVVASVNGGTSTLNQIFMYYFKHFFHGYRQTNDLYYWLGCVPKSWINNVARMFWANNIFLSQEKTAQRFANKYKDLRSNPSSNYKSWSATFDSLVYKGCEDKNNPNNFHCDLLCSHEDYMDHIGYTMNHKYKDIFFVDNNEYQIYLQSSDRNEKYPNESYENIYYYWDRTSGYNSVPWLPVILSTNYPHSKLLYVVRDPLTQMYSRIRQFDEITHLQKPTKQLSEDEANRRFKKLVEFIESAPVNDILLPLLKQNEQTDAVEDDILMWYVSWWAVKGIKLKDERSFDICPYINILMFIKTAQHYNTVEQATNIGLMQFEWMTGGNLLLSSIYLYCWTVFGEKEYGNNCVGKYTRNHYENLDEIMFDWKTIEQNSNYGKLKSYDWNFTDKNDFDKLIEFFDICDVRLMGLIKKYTVLLGEFKLNLWNNQRKEIRQQMETKNA